MRLAQLRKETGQAVKAVCLQRLARCGPAAPVLRRDHGLIFLEAPVSSGLSRLDETQRIIGDWVDWYH